MSAPEPAMQHFDVVVVGAGLSGIGAAVHLQKNCPGRSFAILEARQAIGGTWDLFRYPGVRSDSDMYTLGYAFKPWTGAKSIADGPSILAYIRETVQEHGLEQHIRYSTRVVRAEWSSESAVWTVHLEVGPEKALQTVTCGFLWVCSGYYNYAHGYTPTFPGMDQFKGRMVHPQHWPQDLNYVGQRVVVIGSGATAVTLVPAMAQTAAHVTMLQRSPTYVVTRPSEDRIANALNRLLPSRWAYSMTRWKNVLLGMLFFKLAKSRPDGFKRLVLAGVRKELGDQYDVDKHFNPSYKPWDQRLCMVPDSDLFRAIQGGKASVVTDQIAAFRAEGIELQSGEVLPADVVVTATGLDLLVIGGMELVVDGKPVVMNQTTTYKGMMLSDVPNMAYVVGYTNASWTLKADLVCDCVCRLLNHLSQRKLRQCTPRLKDDSVVTQHWIDFTSGYIQRSLDKFPKQGDKAPWCLHQNYVLDIANLRYGSVEDSAMEFTNPDPHST